MKTSLLLVIILLSLFCSCKKDPVDKVDPVEPETHFLLKKLTRTSSDGSYYYAFTYNNEGKLSVILIDTVTKPGVPSTKFFYDSNGQLILSKEYGDMNSPDSVREIRTFHFNNAGLLVNDSGFDGKMRSTYYYNNLYTYDAAGRLMLRQNSGGGASRFEYAGTSANPVRRFVKPWSEPELTQGPVQFLNYDTKKSWMGESNELRSYFFRSGYVLPYTYENNVTVLNDPDAFYADGTVTYNKVLQQFQYDADNLPTSCTVKEISLMYGDTTLTASYAFEYIKK